MTETDRELKEQLAAYMAPTPDDGFSDALLHRLHAEETPIDLSDYVSRPTKPWRGWLIALILGLTAGLLWNRLGITVPDITLENRSDSFLQSGWGVYALAAICVGTALVFVELERV